MKSRITGLLVVAAIALQLWASAAPAEGQTLLKSICRVKGQEENTLQGLGLVVGLNGTGDGGRSLPTIRSLAKVMNLMGEPLGASGLTELKDAKNVALVTVTATVPAAGARQGDKL
ncbi:MAG: flagellar basal body P-ring protein FlgI, partial [Planctomycetota bacterium]